MFSRLGGLVLKMGLVLDIGALFFRRAATFSLHSDLQLS
jgi:hypothetical protein